MKFILILFSFFVLSSCFNNDSGFDDKKVKGAWILYAMNFTHGHGFKKNANKPYALYDTILMCNIIPLRFDTNYPKKRIHISYDCYMANARDSDLMPFYGANFYEGDSIGVLVEDVMEFHFKKNDFPSDSVLYNFLLENRDGKYSDCLMRLFKLRKNGQTLF